MQESKDNFEIVIRRIQPENTPELWTYQNISDTPRVFSTGTYT